MPETALLRTTLRFASNSARMARACEGAIEGIITHAAVLTLQT
jgi:hypothetical protein